MPCKEPAAPVGVAIRIQHGLHIVYPPKRAPHALLSGLGLSTTYRVDQGFPAFIAKALCGHVIFTDTILKEVRETLDTWRQDPLKAGGGNAAEVCHKLNALFARLDDEKAG